MKKEKGKVRREMKGRKGKRREGKAKKRKAWHRREGA